MAGAQAITIKAHARVADAIEGSSETRHRREGRGLFIQQFGRPKTAAVSHEMESPTVRPMIMSGPRDDSIATLLSLPLVSLRGGTKK